MLKLFMEWLGTLFRELPDVVRIVLEFMWRARWFLSVLFVLNLVHGVVMAMLPYLMVTYAVKSGFGLLSLFFR